MKTRIVIDVEHDKPLPEAFANMVAGRVWSMHGVRGVEPVEDGVTQDMREAGFSPQEIAYASREVPRA